MISLVEDLRTSTPQARGEDVRGYGPGQHRNQLRAALRKMSGEHRDMPNVIDGKEVRTGKLQSAVMPHDHRRALGAAHLAGANEIGLAITAAVRARKDWGNWSWSERAAVFLKAAEILATSRRDELNAATMLGQSKTVHQAEIDSAAELVDFWRFNVAFMMRIYEEQPLSERGVWNRSDYRSLEGFVLALTPFNFTSIAGNLPTAPALMGNGVVWKPAATAKLSASIIMDVLRQAGLPDGVINLVFGDPVEVAGLALDHNDLAGVHFTGSTAVFNSIQRKVASRIGGYRSYPRVVGETGGKNFILAHASADISALATAIIRGGYEYQGQKCSAASRIFVPRSLWPKLKEILLDQVATIKVGDIYNFSNFMGAVIDQRAWTKHMDAFERARVDTTVETLIGGTGDAERGFFVNPTLLRVEDPNSFFMQEEFFGPIVTALVYDDTKYPDIIETIDETSSYGLTGAVFAQDRRAIALALNGLRDAAGNFYINDKPTGAVVGQQPFGGGRASGTNDKAGSMWNLLRWTSPRTIKETFISAQDYRYPFMSAE